MLNDYSFMGVICLPIRFIPYNKDSGPRTDIATLRIGVQQDWDRKVHSTTNTFFSTVICYGKMAKYIHKYGRKGDLIVGRGYLRNGHWKDRDNQDCYSTDIVCERIYLYVLNDPNTRRKYKYYGKDPDFKVEYVEPGATGYYTQMYGYNRTRPNDHRPLIEGTPPVPPDETVFPEWIDKK